MAHDCSEYRQWLALRADAALEPAQQEALAAHLVSCPRCARTAAELASAGEALGAGLKDLAREAPPAPDLLAAIRQRMDRPAVDSASTRGLPGTAGGAGAATSTAVAQPVGAAVSTESPPSAGSPSAGAADGATVPTGTANPASAGIPAGFDAWPDGRPVPGGDLRPLPSTSGLFTAQTDGEFLARFMRVLALLGRAGRPLPQALALVASSGDAGDRVDEVALIARKVEAGYAFSWALSEQPELFPEYVVEAVRAGEASGRLADVLDRLAGSLEMRQENRQRIIANLSYPAVVLALMAVLGTFTGTFILPKFRHLTEGNLAAMPPLSRFLFDVVEPCLRPPRMLEVGAVVIVLAIVATIRRKSLAPAIDGLMLRLPIYRAIYGQYLLSWMASLMAALLRGGVGVPRALELAAAASSNKVYAQHMRAIQARVASGIPLHEAIALSPIFPSDARQILLAGEACNGLEESFAAIAHVYRERLAAELKMVTALAEPLVILVLGVAVTCFCFATYSPIFLFARGPYLRP